MLHPESETATSSAVEEAGASSDMAAIGDEDIGVREGGGGGSEELGGGGSGGNRWPRQETLALLKIRSDMDAVFRDSSLKGPLWEEVSRKMAELGYRRSSKKCREKFENVYKYHKRTKDTRAAKGPDKTYRFFDQLKALESSTQPSSSFLSPAAAGSPPVESAVPIAMAMPPPRPTPQPQPSSTVASAPFQLVMPAIHPVPAAPVVQQSGSPIYSSSSTSSDEGVARTRRRRKWKGLVQRLTKSVMEKQEELHRKFVEAMERRENDRRVREEAWKTQEIARLKREYDILVQERSMAAARDAALTSFLQKLSDHQQIPLPPAIIQYFNQSQPPRPPLTPTGPAPLPVTQTQTPTNQIESPAYIAPQAYNVGHRHTAAGSSSASSSSRWPKSEVEALINLRTGMEQKYQEGGPKGPLWEEISAAMRRIGYDRSSKRCKEKWENINKYFKKVKESDKKRRRDDSKTCPYYHQLEAIYSAKGHQPPAPPIVAQPEQQWPPSQDPRVADTGLEDEELYDDEEDDDQADG
ncbi:hypothetical protein V2J09_019697 [Rumex salicifolius]